MHKIVVTAFKAVAMSIIFIVVWSVVFYLMRVYSLNSKIETVMVSMQQDVARNNYLTEDSYNMYEGILRGIADDMNSTSGGADVYDHFINGFSLNYTHGLSAETSTELGIPADGGAYLGANYSTQLNQPANAGDIAVIELTVGFNAITWTYDAGATNTADQVQNGVAANMMTYVYQVPCLRYVSVTD